jgi:hypothetical protein
MGSDTSLEHYKTVHQGRAQWEPLQPSRVWRADHSCKTAVRPECCPPVFSCVRKARSRRALGSLTPPEHPVSNAAKFPPGIGADRGLLGSRAGGAVLARARRCQWRRRPPHRRYSPPHGGISQADGWPGGHRDRPRNGHWSGSRRASAKTVRRPRPHCCGGRGGTKKHAGGQGKGQKSAVAPATQGSKSETPPAQPASFLLTHECVVPGAQTFQSTAATSAAANGEAVTPPRSVKRSNSIRNPRWRPPAPPPRDPADRLPEAFADRGGGGEEGAWLYGRGSGSGDGGERRWGQGAGRRVRPTPPAIGLLLEPATDFHFREG